MFHPASLLLAWVGAAIALQELSLAGLAAAAILVLPVSAALAPARSWRLVRRSRWLLLSLALLFTFGTPGQVIPGLPWATREGLALATEHLTRLLLLLLLLALLLQRLEIQRLMGGLYLLLAPFRVFGLDRGRAVARLMLVLDYVQRDNGMGWRDWLTPPETEAPAALRLPVAPVGAPDYSAMALLIAGIAAGMLKG